ncbi:unnamed protein product [Durusdinium trenchii]|uniref:PH domain-containing protein n=1 Tax=Durusdinium trenchii TaxID=1381693 RepID=A0ABP0NGY5_9DINO
MQNQEVQKSFLSAMPKMPDMSARFGKESLGGSSTTVTPTPSRSGPISVSLPSEHEVCAPTRPTSRTQPMTGDFRRRKYYIPEEPNFSVEVSPGRDSTRDQLREERDQIMQVKIEGQMQKRSFGCWWTTYWVVLDQSAIRFYNSEQASISKPDMPVEEIAPSTWCLRSRRTSPHGLFAQMERPSGRCCIFAVGVLTRPGKTSHLHVFGIGPLEVGCEASTEMCALPHNEDAVQDDDLKGLASFWRRVLEL